MPKRLTFSYYPWITQSATPQVLKQAIDEFVGLLNDELRRATSNEIQVDPPVVLDVPQQLADIEEPLPAGGDLVGRIGLLNPIGYAYAHKNMGDVIAVAVVLRPKVGGGEAVPVYKAQLYAHRRWKISKLDQVRGRSIAFGSSQSTSNFLVPAAMLMKEKINPLTCFSRTVFAGGHDKAAIAVYEGDVEIGAGHDGVIVDLETKPGYGDARQVLQNFAWSDDIPSDPVAVHASPAVCEQVAKALQRIAKRNDSASRGNQLVKTFWGTDQGFDTIDPNAYKHLVDGAEKLCLNRDDLLRKV